MKELEPAELLGREGALHTSAAAHLENGRDDGPPSTCRPGGPRGAYLATGRSTNDEAPVHQLGVGLLLVAAHGLLRKEVIQPHLPVRLPCYDFTPIADPTFDGSLPRVGPPASGVTDFRGVTGGVYKTRERIHRSIADLLLLANPTS